MDNQHNAGHPVTFLENIALSFSGGGYRASSFSLGVLSYFNNVKIKNSQKEETTPLLENVKGLSTVSGGTLTGAKYAVCIARKDNFDTFYKTFYTFLNQNKLLDNALKKMEDNAIWKATYKKHSLINAFSIAYKEELTDAKFDELINGNGHLEDICFNATDFSFGLAFRFQLGGKFGNFKLQNNALEGAKGEFLIADMIASSSCFPIGFAPMIMPDDYLSPKSKHFKAIKQIATFHNGVGILDGGIVDNQGIGSTMLADSRRDDPYDLIMVCDVGSYMMAPWEQSAIRPGENSSLKSIIKRFTRWLNRKGIAIILALVGIGLTVVGVGDFLAKFSNVFIYFGGILTLTGMLLFLWKLVLQVIFWVIRSKVKKIIPPFFLSKLQFFDDLKINLFRRMMEERLTSGAKMVNDVFLKQIRRLNYDLFYSSPKLENRRASALIYKLTKAQFKDKESDENRGEEPLEDIPSPDDKIFNSAKIATETETTLWFTKADREVERLKNLVACGQFTACYTLLKYVCNFNASKSDTDSNDIEDVKKNLLDHWKEFIDNPYWLWEKSGGNQ